MTRKQALIGIGLLAALSVGAGIALGPELPAMMPTRWDLHGAVSSRLPKAWAMIMMTGFVLFPAVLMLVPRVFKQRQDAEASVQTTDYLYFILSVLFAYTWAVMLAAGLHVRFDVGRAIIAGVFLFTMLLGNVSGRLRRNNGMGYVPSWMTEEIYPAYTRFGSRVLFIVGAIGTVAVLAGVSIPLCMAVLTIAAFSPLGYAYLLRRKGQHKRV